MLPVDAAWGDDVGLALRLEPGRLATATPALDILVVVIGQLAGAAVYLTTSLAAVCRCAALRNREGAAQHRALAAAGTSHIKPHLQPLISIKMPAAT